MGIPLAALAIQPPPDPLRQIGQALAIKGAVQNQAYEQQAQPLQLQERQLQVQQGQQQLSDQQAMTKALQAWDGKDPEDLPGLVLKQGGSATAVFGLKNQIISQRKNLAEANDATLKNQAAQNDLISGHLDALKSAPQDQKEALYQQTRQQLGPAGAQLPPQYPGDDKIDLFEKQFMGHKQILDDEIKRRDTAAKELQAQTTAQKETREAAEFSAKLPGGAQENPEQKFLRINSAQSQGQQVSDADKAFLASYQKNKTMVPTATFNLQNAGATGSNGQPSTMAQEVAAGRMKWNEVISPRTPQSVKEAFAKEVHSINPDFDTSTYALQTKAAEKATSGSWADTRLAYNTALDHSDLLLQAAKALQNGDVRTLNSIKNKFNTEFGGSGQVTFDAIANAYNHEVGSVIAKGHITDKEVETGQATLPDNANFDTIKKVVGAYKGLMSSKRDELDKIIKAGAGNKANGVINTGSSSGGYTPPAGARTATGPNGHKIVVDNGKWVDAETGKPL